MYFGWVILRAVAREVTGRMAVTARDGGRDGTEGCPEGGSMVRSRGTSSAIALALAFVALAPLTPATLATEAAPAREAGTAALAPLPSNFVDESVFGGLTNPTNLAFASDGRVFVTEKSGRVLVFDNLSDTTPTVFADLRTQVHNFWDRGLLGLALDPNFPATPYVYVAYTFDAAIGGTAPRWGTAGQTGDGCPTPPGATASGCVVSSRVSRLTASGNVSTGETVLIEDWCQQFPSHSIGDLAFGPDGALYVSGGDGADFNVADYGQKGSPLNPCGDPPGGVGGTQTPPTAAGGALRSQDLRTSGDPVTLDGAILRVDPATGAGLSGNPLFGNADANARRIIAEGLRNPFRFTFRPGTDEIWVGDVGWNNWEEVDRITDSTPNSVVNFGWPCYEGTGRQAGYDSLDLDICETLYGQSNAVQAPFMTYSHSLDIAPPDDCPPAAPPAPVSSSITGLAFYTGTAFPATYQDALFGADYSRNCIWVMLAGSNGVPDAATIQGFQPAAPNPIGLKMGPDGALYYVDFLGGIRRIRYTVNLPPTASIAASPLSGSTPLTVSFDSQGSTDPEGHPLTYAWDLDDDGSFDDGTDPTASFTYQTTGQKRARLRVTDPGGEIDTDSVLIQVDNTLPSITIDAPQASLTWSVGDNIAFSGTATDPQDGNISSQIDWDLILHHCLGATCHTHAITSFPATASGAFDAPDHDYPSYLELQATVTDSSGATATASTRLDPKTVDLTFGSNPTGLSVIVGGANAQATPFTKTVIVGSTNSISVDSPQVTGGGTSYTFSSWSDGGARSHTITAPATASTYTASFVPTNPSSSCPDTLPAVTAAGWQRNGSATVSGAAVQLTPATSAQAGSVIYTTAQASAALRVCFTADIGTGTGADGMALLLLNPAAGGGALGATGSGLGFGGLAGYAVALDTYDSGIGDPSANFVGIADSGTADALHYLSTSTAIPVLHNGGPRQVEVAVVSGRLQVKVAGVQVLDTAVSLPANVLVGFSAGTGGVTDRHLVSAVKVGSGVAPSPAFLAVAPTSVAFGSLTTGTSTTANVVLTNTGASSLTLSAVTLPAAPFSAVAPVLTTGTVIPAGGSVTQVVRFSPTAVGSASGSLVVTPNTGQGAITVPLSGSGVAPSPAFLAVAPTSVAFGSLTTGTSTTANVVLTNTGASSLTLSAVTLPAAPFSAVAPVLTTGTVIPAGGSVTQVVRFSPTAVGSASGSLVVTPNTGQGAITVPLSGSGVAPSSSCPDTLPAVTAAGWQRNGSATVSGAAVQLTPATSAQAGSVIYTTAQASAALRVCFTADIGTGTGADGMALLLLNPAAGGGALGATGSGLGFGGLAGYAVALDTYDSGIGDPSANFVGIADSGTADALHYLSTSTAIPVLHNGGPRQVEVAVVSGRLQVKVAGVQVLDTAVSLPANVLVGFSAGTGGVTDRHLVSAVKVGSGVAPSPAFLAVAPTSVAFGSLTTGTSTTANVVLTNTGASSLTLSAVTLPAAPFSAVAPVLTTGTVIPAGGSVTQVVRFSPTAVGSASGSLVVTPNTGQGAITVPLSGSGVAPSPAFLAVAPTSVAFGSLTTGTSTTANVVLTNTGASSLTLSAVTLPAAPFSAVAPVLTTGTVIPAGGSVTQVVRFSPTAVGSASGSLVVTPNTGQGAITVPLSGSGVAPSSSCPDTLPAVTAAGWQRNGSATVSGAAVQLTPATSAQAGSVIYTTAQASAALRVCFTADIGTGTGADGMALLLLNPAAGGGALGATGSGLGFGGLAGYAVALDTYDSGIGDPSANFVGIADSGTADALHYLSTSTAIPVLHNGGPRQVEVAVVSGRLQVKVAGVQVLDTAVSLPANVLVGFSAGTGGVTDRHLVSAVKVGSGP